VILTFPPSISTVMFLSGSIGYTTVRCWSSLISMVCATGAALYGWGAIPFVSYSLAKNEKTGVSPEANSGLFN